MSITAIGNSGFNINVAASVSSVGSTSGLGGVSTGNNLDPAALGPILGGIGGAGGLGGTQGNSSVNTVNALATALLIGALASDEEDDKKKSNPVAGAALALLAYGAIMNLNQSSGIGAPAGAITAGAVAATGFSAMA